MAGLRLEGDTSGNVVEVTTGKQLKVQTPTVITEAGYVVAVTENDAGTVTGTPSRRSPRVSQDYRLQVGNDTLLFADTFNSTFQNTALWRFILATMTSTMSVGSLLMNSGSATVSGNACQFTSWRQFSLNGAGGLRLEQVAAFTADPLTNQVVEFGFFPFNAGGAALPTEGVFFRYTSAGLIGVLNFNTTETTTGVLLAPASFTANKNYSMMIRVDQRGIEFIRDGILLGTLAIPNAQGQPNMWGSLPISFQFRNANTVSGAPHMQAKFASCNVVQRDILTIKPWSHQLAMMGLAYQGQNGGTMGSTALYTNSLAPGAGAAIANATAGAGALGLGGQFAVLPTLTASTDGILCSYANPVGTINQTPRTLVVTGVRIQGLVTTALTGGPVLYAYAACWGHSAVSLATGESASFASSTTKAPRRMPLGYETYVVTAPVGALGQGVTMEFDSPLVVNPGEFFAISAKNVGTVTTLGVITFLVTIDHYWE